MYDATRGNRWMNRGSRLAEGRNGVKLFYTWTYKSARADSNGALNRYISK